METQMDSTTKQLDVVGGKKKPVKTDGPSKVDQDKRAMATKAKRMMRGW
jgi:hypothetical protein